MKSFLSLHYSQFTILPWIVLILAFLGFSCTRNNLKNPNHKEIVFKEAIGKDINETDPHRIDTIESYNIAHNSFEGLFGISSQTGSAEKGVVREYSLSEDGLTYTFKLRDDSFFSDHTPVTAQVFVDSWQRALTPSTASPTAYMLAEVIKNGEDILKGKLPPSQLDVKAIDDFTLEVHLAFKAPYLFEILALPVSSPLPTHIIREKGENWNRSFPIISNGPFFMSEWKPSSQVTLLKNPFYYQASQVAIDKIIFYTCDDINTVYNMYLNGEVDVTPIPTDMLDSDVAREDCRKQHTVNSQYYLFNTKRKPLDNPLVRRALSLSINRDILTNRILRGDVFKPLRAAIYKMPGYPSQEYFKDDLVEAKRLLAEAGYPDGKGFPSFSITYNTNEGNKKIAEFIQNQWKSNLGIHIDLQNQEWKTFIATSLSFNYDILKMNSTPDYMDPFSMLRFFTTESHNVNYNNFKYDISLKATNSLNDRSLRMKALTEVEKTLMEDMPCAPLFTFFVIARLFNYEKWDYKATLNSAFSFYKTLKPRF